jgi:asparagine synthase (glutamine-hydrolysing)
MVAMCGISAMVDPAGAPAEVLLRLHAPIRHRGPDGEGFLLVDPAGRAVLAPALARVDPAVPVRVGLAFRRLRIVDVSALADQPMRSPDGSRWLVFNGEIYNFRELRAQLRGRGHAFSSSGDAEVVLAAFAEWGEGCFARFEGMWAIVIADLAQRRVVASRDRFGIKPLYWRRQGDRLLLASEIRQILAATGEPPRVHDGVAQRFLAGSLTPRLEQTFFEGVREAPVATWFEWPFDVPPAGAPVFHPYWRLDDYHREATAPAADYGASLTAFSGIFEEAVASHEVADVPMGALLSGGLDSSAIVGVMARRSREAARPFPTFSFGFRSAAPEVCELPYVDAMVRRDGLVNHETTFDAAWVARNAPRVFETLEEPTLAMPALAQYRVFELAREHGTTVVLDGQGADEILGGYPYFQGILLRDRVRNGHLRAFTTELGAIARRDGRSRAALLSELLWPPLRARLRRREYDWLAPGASPAGSAVPLDRNRDPSAVNRRCHFDVRWGNVRIILSYADKSAMAHTVEARVPYFDRRLVEFAFREPDTHKVGAGERKRLLRDVARRFVVPEITERRDRMGFGVPESRFLRSGLWPVVEEMALDGWLAGSSLVDRKPLRRFVEDFGTAKHDDYRAIWRLYAFATWAERFGVAA